MNFSFGCESAKDFAEIKEARNSFFLSNTAILFDIIFTWKSCKSRVVLLLVDWNFFSPCYLNLTQPVLLHPCSYCKTVSLYFVYVCLPLCLVCSVFLFCDIGHVVFAYLTVFISLIATIMVRLFDQIFFSLKVKQSVNINNKNDLYKLHHNLPNDLGARILDN